MLALVAVATGWWWLLALLAVQLAVGLTLRPPLLPAVRRVLRADPAALRRGAARGLPPAARGEHRRARRAGGRVGRVRRRAGRRSGRRSGCSSPRSRCSRRSPASARAARRTSSACLLRGRPFVSCPIRRRTHVTWQFSLAGAAGRPARRHDRHGRRQPDDADADPALRLRPEDGRRHRHPARRGLQVVRRDAAPSARQRARAARAVDARSARRRSRWSASQIASSFSDATQSTMSKVVGGALIVGGIGFAIKTFVRGRAERRAVPPGTPRQADRGRDRRDRAGSSSGSPRSAPARSSGSRCCSSSR